VTQFCRTIEEATKVHEDLDRYEVMYLAWKEGRFQVGAKGKAGELCAFQVKMKYLSQIDPQQDYSQILTDDGVCIHAGLKMIVAWKRLAGRKWATCYQNCNNAERERGIKEWVSWLHRQESKCEEAP
jgi:hypothetical protein